MVTALFYSIARIYQCLEVPYAEVDPLLLTAPLPYIYANYWLIDVGYSFENAIIVYLLFMWVEVFVSFKTGNLERQQQISRRYAIARTLIVSFIWLVTFWSLYIALYVDTGNGQISTPALWVGTACIGVIILPIIILAAVRWRSLYQQMKHHHQSKARTRFMDLTRASLCGIFSFIMNNIFFGALNTHIVSGDIATYVITSLIPDLQICLAVCWFFSPMRKFQYTDIDGEDTSTGSGARKSKASGVISDGGTISGSINSERMSASLEIMDSNNSMEVGDDPAPVADTEEDPTAAMAVV